MTRGPVSKKFYVSFDHAVDDLRTCLDEISRPTVDPKIECFELHLSVVHITPRILALVVQILNQPLSKAPTGKGPKWDLVCFEDCRFARPGTSHLDVEDDGFCSQDDIEIVASTFASRTFTLQLVGSTEILEYVFKTPHIELWALHLVYMRFSALECTRLGGLLKSCGSLEYLDIETNYLEDPLVLAEGLANSVHLKGIMFKGIEIPQHALALSDVLVRSVGNCIVGQLLRPQSQLHTLMLRSMNLEDEHFRMIVKMLPTSQVQHLHLQHNKIDSYGITVFGRQLPRIKCLKEVILTDNPWEDDIDGDHRAAYNYSMAALLKGMLENHSIESLPLPRWDEQVEYCTFVNRSRGRILATANSIPIELWPLLLELVGTRKWCPSWEGEGALQKYRANALFFIIQMSPIPSFTRSIKRE